MWKKRYKENKCYWGLKPDTTLEKYIAKISKGRALDIGAGEGRNSFFLAQNGFKVTAVDKTQEGLEKIEKVAEKNKLSIETVLCNIKNFEFKEKYSLVISVSSVDFLKKSEVDIVLDKIKKSLEPGGFVFLSVFSTKDPLFKIIKERGTKEVEKNTFYLPKFKIHRHFFTKEEIEEVFKNFNIILLKQTKILDKGHDKPHYHGIIKLLAQK